MLNDPKMKARFLISFICAIILVSVVLIIFNDCNHYFVNNSIKMVVPRLNPVREHESKSTKTDSSYLHSNSKSDTFCYNEPSDINGFLELDPSKEKEGPNIGRSIFFHETSCFREKGTRLNARQACAVESAARMNPNMNVYLLFLSPSKISISSNLLIQQLLSYDNIKIRRIYINKYMKSTPLGEWYADGNWKSSQYPTIHTADILRFVTLWKYGGIYLDLDVIITKSLENLENFSGAQDNIEVAAGVMGFGMGYLGRKVAEDCLKDLKINFKGNSWSNNAPGVITRVLQKLCNATDPRDMTPFRCDGFMVYPPSVFYPIYYPSWKKYFELDGKNETMEKIEKSKAIHVWNKLSKLEKVQVGSEVPYAIIAQEYCPKVYNNCGTIF